MAIEKFLAMEDGEPGYTKLGTVTHVPFPAGGNGVQIPWANTSASDNVVWALPNLVEVPVAPAFDYFLEFTSDSVWAVAFRNTGGIAFDVRIGGSGIVTGKTTYNAIFASVTTGIDTGVSHRWGVTGGLDVAGGGRRFSVWCDGVEVAVGTTAGSGTTKVNQIMLAYNRDVGTSRFDSVVISDAFQGDCHVDYLVPDGNGDTSQWVGSDSDSVDNWELVDEIPPSGADYVEADEVDLRDLYTVANLPASGTILGVQAVVHPWKLGSGAEIPTSTILKTAAGEHVDLIAGMSTAMQGLETPIRTTRPGGGAWTVSDVNAMQIGVTTEEP